MNITYFQLALTLPVRLRPWLMTLLCFTNLAIADSGKAIDRSAIEETIRKALPNTEIISVETSVIPGFIEIVGTDNILYSDITGRYLMIGSIYDMQTATDLTAQRKREVVPSARIKWDELPLETAVRYGGLGPAKLAIFFDPDCHWCKQLHQQLSALNDIEVYAMMYPVSSLHTGTTNKAAAILCSDDPLQALNTVMAGKDLPTDSNPDCLARSNAAIDRIESFARSHDIQGTPTLVAPDGRVHPGYLQTKALKTWLNAAR